MGRYIQQNESRSELQQRLDAELRAKAAAKAKVEGGAGGAHDAPDGVDDAAYLNGTKTTTTLAPAWFIIFLLAVGVFAFFVYQASR